MKVIQSAVIEINKLLTFDNSKGFVKKKCNCLTLRKARKRNDIT